MRPATSSAILFCSTLLFASIATAESDPFIELAREVQGDFTVNPVIEKGHHNLETQFVTQESPSKLLEIYQKTFQSAGIAYRLTRPTEQMPIACFTATVDGEKKNLMIVPSKRDGANLVKISAAQNNPAFQQRYPSLLETMPEYKQLVGKMSYSHESFMGESQKAIFTYTAPGDPAGALKQASSELADAGWSEGPARKVTANDTSSRTSICMFRKGNAAATIAANPKNGVTRITATVTVH